jgi:predicted amidohydrolase YtcJ
MLPRNLLLLAGILTLMSCQPNADLVVHNALVYTVNKDLDKVQAFAVKDGKFIDVGNNDILDKYKAKNVVDAQGLPIFPGLIDAHSHFLQLGLSLQQAQLEGTESFEAFL